MKKYNPLDSTKHEDLEKNDDLKKEIPNSNDCTLKKIIICLLKKICILLISFSLLMVLFFVLFFMEIKEKKSVKEKKFTKREIEIAKYNTVIKLNNIKLPLSKSNESYDDECLYTFYNFTYNFFKDIGYTHFSPISLYGVLINIYMAISDKELSELLNNILGLSNDERIIFYTKIFNKNNFKNLDDEIKISNGAFYNSDRVTENISFIEQMSKTYTECYKLSYKKDYNFIIEWIKKSLKDNEDSFKDNFDNNNDKIGILFYSNLYYKQKWKTKFSDSETYKDIFYIDNNNKKEVVYMKHSYQTFHYCDYDKYISFYDYYNNYYIIQYIVPKSINDNILDLVDNKNFILEDEYCEIPHSYIILSVPKFKIDNEIDFVPILKKIGFEKLFNKNYSTLNNPFIIRNDINYCLDKLLQKNQIELNEDGTTIKSMTIGTGGAYALSASKDDRGVEVKLNQPFIYIIRDRNNLPIFMGYIKEPK